MRDTIKIASEVHTPYSARPSLMAQMRNMRQLKAAIAQLSRTHPQRDYLADQLRRQRADFRLNSARATFYTLHFGTLSDVLMHGDGMAHPRLVIAFQNIRQRARADIQNRRQRMRAPRAHGTWSGPYLDGGYVYPYSEVRTRTRIPGAPTLCGVHNEPGEILRRMEAQWMERMYRSKLPTDDRLWASVEVECITEHAGQEETAQALRPWARYVCIKSDSSVMTDRQQSGYERGTRGGTPQEIVITAPQEEIAAVIQGVCSALVEKCGAYVNKSCGLHVHLDMRSFNRKQAFSNLVAGQKLLRMLVPKHRLDSRYCRPVKGRDWPAIGSSRYKAINAEAWRRHQTLEVRLFAGTVSADKIVGYVKICAALAYAETIVVRAPRTLKGWTKAFAGLVPFVPFVQKEVREHTEAPAAVEQAPSF